MFQLVGNMLKLAIFIVVVLVLGNWIEIKGKTLSEYVRTQMTLGQQQVDQLQSQQAKSQNRSAR